MTAEAHYKIKNWDRFQHYHKPRPSWIKLHRTLLDDLEFQALSCRSRALLVMLWLVAAESEDGTLPSVKAISWRLRLPEREVSKDIQSLSHYLECVYADSRASLALDRDREEKEKEIEGEALARQPVKKLLDFIVMTEEEHSKLKAALNGNLDTYLERLNGYLGQTGKKYKSHYHTILNWYRKDVDAGKVPKEDQKPQPVVKCSKCNIRAAYRDGLCAPCLEVRA